MTVQTTDWLRQLNEWCDAFEKAWRSGSAPKIEAFLGRAPADKRQELLREILLLDVAYRRRRGDRFDAAEYVARFPTDATAVAQVFATRGEESVHLGPEHNPGEPNGDTEIIAIAPPAAVPAEQESAGTGAVARSEEVSPPDAADSALTHIEPRVRRTPISVLPVHTRVGHFELLEEIGRGGMGVVYKARQVNLGRTVALKMILAGEFADAHDVERFRAEAEAAAQLKHPNIVPIYEVGEEAGRHFFAMALIEGHDLREALRDGPLPPAEAARLIQRVAQAVHCAHSQGIIHRDLKPGNILLDRQGEPHITDFGLVRRHDGDSSLTATGQILGTVGYIPPEQARDRSDEIGPHSDLYTLGALLYKCLTGRPPFQAADPIEALRQGVEDDPVSPRLLSPGVPRDLETLCLKCLEKEPHRRLASAQELADELARYLRGEPIRSRPIGRAARAWRWCRRRPAAAGLALVSGGAAALLVAGLVLHSTQIDGINRQLTKKTNDALRNEQAAQRQKTIADGLREDAERHASVATQAQARAETSERQTKDRLYAFEMKRAAEAFDAGDVRTVFELLKRQVPRPGEPDRRGFEWHCLSRLIGADHATLLKLDTPIYFLCASSDQQLMAAMGQDAVVRFFRPDGTRDLPDLVSGQIEVNGAAFSPDGRCLATAGDDGTVCIWDVATRQRLRSFRGHPGKAFQVVYSPDGSLLACCGEDPVVRLFDPRIGQPLGVLEGHTRTVQALVISDDGRLLATTSSDETARIWNLHQRQATILSHPPAGVNGLAFFRGGKSIATSTDAGTVHTWNTADGRELSALPGLDGVTALALSPAGNELACADARGCIQVRAISEAGLLAGEQVPRIWQAGDDKINALLWRRGNGSPEDSRLYAAGHDGRLTAFDLSQRRNRRNQALPRDDSQARIEDFALLSNTRSVLIASANGVVRHGLHREGAETRLPGSRPCSRVFVSANGRFAAATADKIANVVFWDVDRPAETRSTGLPSAPQGAALSPDGSVLAVSVKLPSHGEQFESAVVLVDLSDSTIVGRIPASRCEKVLYAPNGKLLAIQEDIGILVCDVATRAPVWRRPQRAITQIAISRDSRYLATSDADRQVIVRDLQTGDEVHRLLGHLSRVNCVAFSPDGRTLATGAGDGQIKLWHVASGQHLCDLDRHDGECRALQFTDDAHLLVCLADSGQMFYYDATPGEADE